MARGRGDRRRGPPRTERPPLRVLPMIGLSLLLLLVGWTALWFFARYEAVATFARWRVAEQRFGRAWTCPDERVSGFPLGITLACDHPTFKGPVGDGLFEGSIAGLTADARLYFPTNVVVTLAGPLRMTEVAGPRHVDASWSDGTLTLRGILPGDLDRGQLDMSGLGLGPVPAAGGAAALGTIGHLSVSFKPVDRNAEARMDLDSTVTVTDAHIPALDAALGSTAPLNLKLGGFVTQVAFAGGVTLPELLDPWVVAGGQVHVQTLEADKGALRLRAAGRIGLDEDHRLQGRLDAAVSGLAPVAARLGIPLGAVQVGSLLSGLFGGGAPAVAAGDAAPADLTLPLVAKDGRLKLGPVDTGVRLTPVY